MQNIRRIGVSHQDKLSKLQPSEKPQLYIGGIFPITGTKYKAPELAAGLFPHISLIFEIVFVVVIVFVIVFVVVFVIIVVIVIDIVIGHVIVKFKAQVFFPVLVFFARVCKVFKLSNGR